MPKNKKVERRKKEKSDDDDDEFDNIDKECDRALDEARKKAATASLRELIVTWQLLLTGLV